MLDLARLSRIRLRARPRFQRVVALALLAPNYDLPPRVKIDFEGDARVPDEPVIFAMNHTDRYNYWPFQYAWWRRRERFTATWVKGKYYENEWVGRFMELTNNIPTVSRGYLITKYFLATLGRRTENEEYTALRALVNEAAAGRVVEPDAVIPRALLERRRDMLGRPFDPAREPYAVALDQLFRAMMRRFTELNREAADLGLDILIFPQGTRSVRLSRGWACRRSRCTCRGPWSRWAAAAATASTRAALRSGGRAASSTASAIPSTRPTRRPGSTPPSSSRSLPRPSGTTTRRSRPTSTT